MFRGAEADADLRRWPLSVDDRYTGQQTVQMDYAQTTRLVPQTDSGSSGRIASSSVQKIDELEVGIDREASVQGDPFTIMLYG